MKTFYVNVTALTRVTGVVEIEAENETEAREYAVEFGADKADWHTPEDLGHWECRVVDVEMDSDDEAALTQAELNEQLTHWLAGQGLDDPGCGWEVMNYDLPFTNEQREWLADYKKRWDAARGFSDARIIE